MKYPSSGMAHSFAQRPWLAVAFVASVGSVLACFGSPPVDEVAKVVDADLAHFAPKAISGAAKVVDCTLSNGTQTKCHEFQLFGTPVDHDIGPFCPDTITDGPEVGGQWMENDQMYDLTGPFIKDLGTFYDDDHWQLYDKETGKIHVTDTKEGCLAAARPDVAEEYQNYCVECRMDDLEHKPSIVVTIPVTPVKLQGPAPGRTGKIGVALNGVVIDPPAPTDHILAAYTIAAFDDCGGHINPHTGYHYHAAVGCGHKVAQDDQHAPLIGYGLDGFGLYAYQNDSGVIAKDLDECRGHEDDKRGYHYHVDKAGTNQHIPCFMGALGSMTE